MSKNMNISNRVDDACPIHPEPGYREKQRKAIVEIVKGVMDPDVDVVLLNAPTGSGKSIDLHTTIRATGKSAFFTTPLNSLVDQLDNDGYIKDDIITLKGRNNYNCIHPEDEGTRVDEAICQRDSSFECDVKDQCPYYGRKAAALQHPEVITNMSYLMAEGLIPAEVEDTFGNRDILVVDECQNIDDFAENFISFTVSGRTVPDMVWDNLTIPSDKYEDNMDYLIEWVREDVLGEVTSALETLETMAVLSKDQSSAFENLRQFKLRVENFLDDVQENHWVGEMDVVFRKRQSNQRKISFKPLTIGRFLDELLWNRGETVVLSSATIPSQGWLDEIGLGDANKKKISVPSTFPIENRPIIMDLDVGKMVSEYSDEDNNRKTNAWDMCQRIMQIHEHHTEKGQPNGFIHCRSYGIAKLLKRTWENNGERDWVQENVMIQDRNDREKSLEDWIDSDIDVFLSVAMDEGVDLKYDKCHWQVLAKTLYPFMDKRMKKRKEVAYNEGNKQDFWNYYNRKAVIQLQQAYGRGVRAPDDECVFYVLDTSAKTLIKRNAEMFNKWFLEAIDDMRIDPSRGM